MHKYKDFNNKVVVITGAGSGMGRAYALAFARLGAKLALCDVDSQALEQTQALVAETSTVEVFIQTVDISDNQAVLEFATLTEQQLGPCLVLINNAGIEGSAKPTWATQADWYGKVMGVNFFGVVNGTSAFLPFMRQRNRGVIVNVSSIFGLSGMPNHSDYCASKFAVAGYSESLMAELLDSDIQVHLLHPGGIATNFCRADHSQGFNQHFLTTSADDIAAHLIKCIRANKRRIVFGNGAAKTWLAVRVLPMMWRLKFAWFELKRVIDTSDYRPYR